MKFIIDICLDEEFDSDEHEESVCREYIYDMLNSGGCYIKILASELAPIQKGLQGTDEEIQMSCDHDTT